MGERSILDRLPFPAARQAREDLRLQAFVVHRPLWGLSVNCERAAHRSCTVPHDDCLCTCHDRDFDWPLRTVAAPSAPELADCSAL